MSRRLLMVNYYFPPQNVVAVFRALRFASNLDELGWTPVVLTCHPDPGEVPLDEALLMRIPARAVVERVAWRRPEDAIKAAIKSVFPFRRRASNQNGQTSEATSGAANGHPPGWRAKISELLFAIPDDKIAWKRNAVKHGVRLASKHNVSAIYAAGPPFSGLLAGAEISRNLGLPLIVDFRDPWARCPWGSRMLTALAQRKIEQQEAAVVRQARAVILNTERMAKEFREFYRREPQDKFLAIPNGIDVDIPFDQPRIQHQARRKVFRLLHAGALYGKRDPRPLIDAVARLTNSGCQVTFDQIGTCDPQFQADAYVRDLGLIEQIHLLPPIRHHEVSHRMSQADAFLLYQPGTAMQVPAKLFEMIPHRKPIVAIVEPGAAADIVNEYGLGTIGTPGNVTNIADAILAVTSDYQRICSEGRWDAVLQDFNGRKLTQRLASLLDEMVAGN